jgi:hypothetical protein
MLHGPEKCVSELGAPVRLLGLGQGTGNALAHGVYRSLVALGVLFDKHLDRYFLRLGKADGDIFELLHGGFLCPAARTDARR